MYCMELERLLRKYGDAETKEDIYIRRTLENIAAQFDVCDPQQRYYADVVARDFCRIIEMLEKRQDTAQAPGIRYLARPTDAIQYRNGMDLLRDFYNYYKTEEQADYREIADAVAQGRRDLVNPTMRDYAARIFTFTGEKYLGEMYSLQEIGNQDPILFVYDNLEQILATFRTRDEEGNIIKQRVNIRSALRKLNEFKQRTRNTLW